MHFFNFLKRYIVNLARLNNLKFRVDLLEDQNKLLKEEISLVKDKNLLLKNQLDNLIMQLQEQNTSFAAQLQQQEQKLPRLIAKEIFYQSLSLQQRVDQFAFDANIELKTKIAQENE